MIEKREIDKERIQRAVKEILSALGEDVNREGILDTPDRVARMYEELMGGYNQDAEDILSKTFVESGSGLVIEKNINFSSMCEHHLMPFFGKVHIGYIPNGKVVGLSKLARIVDMYAKRLQLQERMNTQIAQAIFDVLAPKGVIVAVEGEHTCMTSRGVKKFGSKTITFAERGYIDSDTRMRFLSIINAK